MPEGNDADLLEIEVDFKRGEGDPTRAFKAMSGLIESVQAMNSHFADAISTTVETELVLQDIEAGSLRSKLRTVVKSIPEEPLKEGNVKAVIGHYLHRAKHRVLDWCGERNEIKTREEVKELQSNIHDLAKETDIKMIPTYSTVTTETLLSDINSIRDALINLEETDTASMRSEIGRSSFNKALVMSPDVVRELVTKETIVSEGERIVKIKKPDYLGLSKWVVKYAGHLIETKILDSKWLAEFQARNIPLQPQDSLRVSMKEELSYGYDNQIVHISYSIVKVLEVIPAPKLVQTSFLE